MISSTSVNVNSNLSSTSTKSISSCLTDEATLDVVSEQNQGKKNRKLPQVLSLAISRSEIWSKKSWTWLARIRLAVLERVCNGKRLSTKSMRSEQRHAIASLLKVILENLDLNTMQIGFVHRETGVFIRLTLAYLAKQAKLELKTAERAMKWLYESSYVTGTKQFAFDIETKQYINKPSIRVVSSNLLFDFGITSFAFNHARERSRKYALKKSVSQIYASGVQAVKNIFSKVIKKTSATFKTSKDKVSFCIKEYEEKLNKLRLAFPNKSEFELKDMLPRPPD